MSDMWTRGPVDELTLHKPEDVPWWERIKGIKAKCSCGWTSNEWTGPIDFIGHAREYSAAQFAAERQKTQPNPQTIATWSDETWVYKVTREKHPSWTYNPEDVHGPWNKETQRYEDGCKAPFVDMVRKARKPKRCATCGGTAHPGLGCGPRGAEPGPYED